MSELVFEGRVSAEAVLECGKRTVHRLLLSPHSDLRRLERLVDVALSRDVPVEIVRTDVLAQLAGDTAHGGVIALCSERRYEPVEQMLAWVGRQKEPVLIFVLAGFEDAYNLGYALRVAEAFGAGWVLCDRKEWVKDEATVLRSSAGAFERLPVSLPESLRPALQGLKERGVRLLAALEEGTTELFAADLRGSVAWMVGGEKRGLSQHLRELADMTVRIPTRSGVPPLPASHAVTVLAAETFRQRLGR